MRICKILTEKKLQFFSCSGAEDFDVVNVEVGNGLDGDISFEPPGEVVK